MHTVRWKTICDMKVTWTVEDWVLSQAISGGYVVGHNALYVFLAYVVERQRQQTIEVLYINNIAVSHSLASCWETNNGVVPRWYGITCHKLYMHCHTYLGTHGLWNSHTTVTLSQSTIECSVTSDTLTCQIISWNKGKWPLKVVCHTFNHKIYSFILQNIRHTS